MPELSTTGRRLAGRRSRRFGRGHGVALLWRDCCAVMPTRGCSRRWTVAMDLSLVPMVVAAARRQEARRCRLSAQRRAVCGLSTAAEGAPLAHGGESVRGVCARVYCNCERQGEKCAVAERHVVVDVVVASERRGKRSPKSGGRAELKHMSLERPSSPRACPR